MNITKIIDRLYDENDGYGEISNKDEKRIKEVKSSSVYGEITTSAAQKLIDYMDLGKKDVFYDLGSGVGRLVLHTALSSNAKKIVGIELSSARHKIAKEVLKIAQKERLVKCQNVEYWCSDILRRRLDDATFVYTCSTAFPDRFFRKLVKRLSILKTGVKFISLTDIDWESKYFKQIDQLKLDMSWQKRTPVFVYERTDKK